MAKSVFGKRIIRLGTVSSTQDILKNQFYDGAEEGTIAIAEEQLMGKGRQGRIWDSAAGKGMWASFLLVPTGPEAFWSWVPLWAGMVLKLSLQRLPVTADALSEILLKWPNDLYYHENKLGGILAEKVNNGKGTNAVVLGIGVNLTQSAEDFPPHLRKRAVSLQDITGQSCTPDMLLEALIMTAEDLISLLKPIEGRRIRELWLEHAWGLKNILRVISGHRVLEGVFTDLGPHGELCLQISENDLRYIVNSDGIEKVYIP
jgi:BirA family biotin operon repressor/biotin-[acetyl-CoA-carboxylase] ligase